MLPIIAAAAAAGFAAAKAIGAMAKTHRNVVEEFATQGDALAKERSSREAETIRAQLAVGEASRLEAKLRELKAKEAELRELKAKAEAGRLYARCSEHLSDSIGNAFGDSYIEDVPSWDEPGPHDLVGKAAGEDGYYRHYFKRRNLVSGVPEWKRRVFRR
ncbi:hypothetical protein N9261_00545 [bacterium]|nr:hypothetical protein [bacterium]